MVSTLLATLWLAGAQQLRPLPNGPVKLPPLMGLDGRQHAAPEPDSKLTVALFIAVDCPIANRYAPEVSRIHGTYAKKGVSFLRVYVDPTIPKAEIIKHGKDFKLRFPAVIDAKHEWVKGMGVAITPEAAVLDGKGNVLYRGRIDDRFVEHGRAKDNPDRRDLKIALDEALAGKAVSQPNVPSIGCFIPNLPDR
ncbi:MAG: hypothetical protein HONBIEJF_01905 [Fimbriimonadaceae bacterium]|nr:hypothetical protein [Fimbriimonadaceae bacterium]